MKKYNSKPTVANKNNNQNKKGVVTNTYKQFQSLEKSKNLQKQNQIERDLIEGEEGIRRFYEQMDGQQKDQQQQQQYAQKLPQEQDYQPQKMTDDESARVEKELRELELEQQRLEQEILQRQQQNEYLDQALEQEKNQKVSQQQNKYQQSQEPIQDSYDLFLQQQQKQKQQQANISQQQQYQAQPPQQQQKSQRSQISNNIFGGSNEQQFTQQQRTSKHLLNNQNTAPKSAMDQKYDDYMAKKGNQKYQRIEQGLIGIHQEQNQPNVVNANKQRNMASNVFGGGDYNYFQDKDNQKIDQHVYGRLKRVPDNYDPMQGYQKQVEKEIQSNQENFLNSIKPNQSSASKYKKTQLW